MVDIAWPKTTLIVDDSLVARLGAKKVLKEMGAATEVVEANTADAGYAKWAETMANLAIIDFNMPGDDGLELCAKLRNENPDMPLILCTANIQKAVSDRAEALNVAMINKPLTATKLEPIIKKFCD